MVFICIFFFFCCFFKSSPAIKSHARFFFGDWHAVYSNHPDHSVELSCDNSMVSQTTPEESLMIPDFSEFIVPDRSGILLATAAAISTLSIAIGTIDGARYRVHNNTNKTSPYNNNSQSPIGKLVHLTQIVLLITER